MTDRSVSIRELNQHTSRVIHEVAEQHRGVTVTSNGEQTGVAVIPIERGPAVLDELVKSGRAVAPTIRGPITACAATDSAGERTDVAAALAADREQERW